MQELIKKVTEAAGISEDQARKAIETVSTYVKDKMPETFRSQIDNLVNGGSISEGLKSKMNEVASEFRDKAEDLIEDVREKLGDIFSKKDEGEKPS